MADASTILETLKNFQADSSQDEAIRKEMLTAARALVARLETPFETVFHMSHEIPALNAALRVALDQGVFEKLEKHPTTPQSPEQLTSNAEPALLDRFLKHLATMNIIKLAGTSLYLPTRHSSSLVSPTTHATTDYFRDVTSKAFINLPTFLAQNNYVDPASLMPQTNWQHLLGRDESHFEWLADNPAIMQNFGNMMAGYTSQRGSWLDVFDGPALLKSAHADGPLLVDVGGSLGQDMTKYLKAVPASAGRLIVQDLPQVVQDATSSAPAGITLQAHDFFTPQPVHGARAYFLHSVLHDWPDDKCAEILASLTPALERGYSRVLINEVLVSARSPTLYSTTLDLTMLALFSARERTEDDWRAMLARAGLRVVRVWTSLAAAEAVVEAEMA